MKVSTWGKTTWLVCAASLGLVWSAPGWAQDDPARSLQVERDHTQYVVNADGSYTETRELSTRILLERGIESAKDAGVSYSTSIQTAEVLSAYTLKANGQRIDVPRSNYQVSASSGRDGDSPIYSDQTRLTVVFPDLAVGDSTVFSYRLVARQPMFAQQFSMIESYSPATYYGDVQVSIDWPDSLPLRFQSWQLQQTLPAAEAGRKRVQWQWRNTKPIKPEDLPQELFRVERYPGFAVSSFSDYAQIAQAYGSVADGKAAPTPRIRALAESIVGKQKDPREVTRLLYEWVAQKISYAGNCIGLGAVVPRDLDVVLDNKMGDCKDHATLLQALLSSRGIASSQALVNAGGLYYLPEIPVVAMVNHVINYVPSLDLYLDSTAAVVPFGSLPGNVAGKPVLLVHGHRDGASTPQNAVGREGQRFSATIRVLADGTVQGQQKIDMRGQVATGARSQFRNGNAAEADKWVKQYFRGQGLIATGTMKYADPQALLDTFDMEVSYDVAQMLPRSGGLPISAVFYNPVTLNAVVVGQLLDPDKPSGETQCAGVLLEESFEYEFADGLRIVSVPSDVKVEEAFLRYESSYRREGNRVHVRRVFDDRTPGPICSGEYNARFDAALRRLLPDLKAQIVYLSEPGQISR